MRRPFVLSVVALVVGLTGCSGSDSDKVTTPTAAQSSVGPFTLTMTPSPSFDTMSVSGTTNLPDGTLVTVLLGRNVKFEGEDARSFHLGGEGVPVKGGQFRADIELEEGLMVSGVTDDSTFGPLESISNTVSACAQVRPNEEGQDHQPKDVQVALGENGVNLKSSPQMKEFGDGYWLEVLTNVDLPSPSLGAIEQEVGKVKTVTDSAEDLFCVS